MGVREKPFSLLQCSLLVVVVFKQLIETSQVAAKKTYNLKGVQGIFQSEGFPKGYDSKEDSLWKISGYYGDSTRFLFVFIWLDIRPGYSPRSCERDYLSILESYSGKLAEIKRYCGRKGFFLTTAYGKLVGVGFKTSRRSDRKGFRVSWRAIKDGGKWRRFRTRLNSQRTGLLQSTGFPYFQPYRLYEKWRLELPKGFYQLVIRFIWFNVGLQKTHSKCHSNVLKILQEFNGQYYVQHKLCGYRKSFTIMAYGSKFEFQFKSKKYVKKPGFRMIWYALKGCYEESGYKWDGTFSTHGYSEHFHPFGQCQWKIQIPIVFGGIDITFPRLTNNVHTDRTECRDQQLVIQNGKQETVKTICNMLYPSKITLSGHKFILFLRVGKLKSSSGLTINWAIRRNQPVCGSSDITSKNHRQRRIIGGQVKNEDWSWVIQIRTTLDQGGFKRMIVRCAGTLVTENWIITAAHCVYFLAQKGKLTVEVDNNIITSSNIHIHPEYKGGISNDIALIRYHYAASNEITPICLPDFDQKENFSENSDCFLSGWGKTENNNPSSHRLTTSVVYYGKCTTSSSLVCAGDPNRISGACEGDSGGPLMCSNGERYFLAGVLSHGPKQCGSDLDIYINPKHYIEWVKDIMIQNSF